MSYSIIYHSTLGSTVVAEYVDEQDALDEYHYRLGHWGEPIEDDLSLVLWDDNKMEIVEECVWKSD